VKENGAFFLSRPDADRGKKTALIGNLEMVESALVRCPVKTTPKFLVCGQFLRPVLRHEEFRHPVIIGSVHPPSLPLSPFRKAIPFPVPVAGLEIDQTGCNLPKFLFPAGFHAMGKNPVELKIEIGQRNELLVGHDISSSSEGVGI
jgi:hypothetical protein